MKTQLVLALMVVALAASMMHLVIDTMQYDFPPDITPNPMEEEDRRVTDTATNITWFVHITDLHLSKFHAPDRTWGFLHLTEDILKHLDPMAIVVTGDLTDAKTADYSGSHQFVEEWRDYYTGVRLAGNRTVWLDIRGNHDNFDVPDLEDKENFFREFSSQGRKGNLGSYLKVVHRNGVRLAFLAIDATLKPVGPRRPFNFVGALNRRQLENLEDLAREARQSSDGTVWFGHYPTSTIASPAPGHRELMASGLVYLCGHLHNLHGLAGEMLVRHRNGLREAELTDWKDNRMFRVMAVDHGVMSWRDVDAETGLTLPLVLVTWPPGGLRAGDREPLHRIASSSHIRLLVFSKTSKKVKVGVRIDGGTLEVAERKGDSLYTVAWQPGLYTRGVHTLLVEVEEEGQQVHVDTHRFSLDGSHLQQSFIGRMILLVDLIALFQFFFILQVSLCVLPLTLLRLYPSPSFIPQCILPMAHLPNLYWPLVLSPLYLTIGPWFVGELLTGSLGVVFVWGSLVQGVYLPTATTWLYGNFHLIGIHWPLMLATALALHSRLSKGRGSPCHPVTSFLLRHGLMFPLVIMQGYLVYSFHLSYGTWAVILGPYRTGYLLLILYLWGQVSHQLSQSRLLACVESQSRKTF